MSCTAMNICPAQPWRTCAAIVMRTLRACFGDFALGGEILRIWSVAVALSAVMLRCERALASEPAAAVHAREKRREIVRSLLPLLGWGHAMVGRHPRRLEVVAVDEITSAIRC